ncbi:hypothetical protein Hamer_G011466 [Homarus americanus]|uniref:Uncharacterized protein n=1 Tax=Homarus americanus TaxID=6706 RepID=A0A8J5JJF9_HOMAM|nr:hypothetical protein Hamer_G011466 [Homarus americanus]
MLPGRLRGSFWIRKVRGRGRVGWVWEGVMTHNLQE